MFLQLICYSVRGIALCVPFSWNNRNRIIYRVLIYWTPVLKK
jgi:hypothetical protein